MAKFNIIQPKEPTEGTDQRIIDIIVAEDMETAESVIDTEVNLIVENTNEEGIEWIYHPDNSSTPFTAPSIKLPEGFNQEAFKEHLKEM